MNNLIYQTFLNMKLLVNGCMSYRTSWLWQYILVPVLGPYDEMIPHHPEGQSSTLTHTLMVPPAVPHVSGRVMQTSVWIPKSTHWLLVPCTVHALFTW